MQTISYLRRLQQQKQSPRFDQMVAKFLRRERCPVKTTLAVIGGKWKPVVFYLIQSDVARFGELLALLDGISKKVLTDQLRELEQDGIISRTVYAAVPPHVEYALTEFGQTLAPVVAAMCAWGLNDAAKTPSPDDAGQRDDGLEA